MIRRATAILLCFLLVASSAMASPQGNGGGRSRGRGNGNGWGPGGRPGAVPEIGVHSARAALVFLFSGALLLVRSRRKD